MALLYCRYGGRRGSVREAGRVASLAKTTYTNGVLNSARPVSVKILKRRGAVKNGSLRKTVLMGSRTGRAGSGSVFRAKPVAGFGISLAETFASGRSSQHGLEQMPVDFIHPPHGYYINIMPLFG